MTGPQLPPRGSSGRLPGLSLRARGLAALVIPLAALLAALFAIYSEEEASARAGESMIEAYETRAELLQLRLSELDAETQISHYLAVGRAVYLAAFESARAALSRSLERLASVTRDDPESRSAYAGIGDAIASEMRVLGELSSGALPSAASARALQRAKELGLDVQHRLERLNRAQDQRLARAGLERAGARRGLMRVILFCGIAGPLGALFVHLLVFGGIVRRLKQVGENARRLAEGLAPKPRPPYNDEIGAVAAQLEESALLLRAQELQLRESEQRYRDLFNQAPVPYQETDREGIVHYFNQAVCDLLKCPPERIAGRPAWEFVAADSREEHRIAMLDRVSRGVASGPFECEFLLDDGSRLIVEIRENPIRGQAGEIAGICRSLVDVTERNLAAIAAGRVAQYAMELRNRNEQLAHALTAARSATDAKGRFLAGVSHELRTPLNAIIGFSEILYDGKAGPVSEMHRELLGDILTSAHHLQRLINDVLDLSKVEAGKMEFRPELCALDALVREVCDVIRPLADKKRLLLTAAVPPGFTVFLDGSRFKQVLYNYLSNAVKFTPEGGRVEVRIGPDREGYFRLDVEDTGVGIPPEELPLLFQEFQQLPNSRKAEQGTGLGLALTRHIVEAQGGTVAVRSTPGQGSIFSAVLPERTPGSGTVNGGPAA